MIIFRNFKNQSALYNHIWYHVSQMSINQFEILFKTQCTVVKKLNNQALSLLQSYLCSRFQKSLINGSFISLNEVVTEVPQGSILGPLLFNIFLNDNFLFISKFQLYEYADDNTLYKSRKNMY